MALADNLSLSLSLYSSPDANPNVWTQPLTTPGQEHLDLEIWNQETWKTLTAVTITLSKSMKQVLLYSDSRNKKGTTFWEGNMRVCIKSLKSVHTLWFNSPISMNLFWRNKGTNTCVYNNVHHITVIEKISARWQGIDEISYDTSMQWSVAYYSNKSWSVSQVKG